MRMSPQGSNKISWSRLWGRGAKIFQNQRCLPEICEHLRHMILHAGSGTQPETKSEPTCASWAGRSSSYTSSWEPYYQLLTGNWERFPWMRRNPGSCFHTGILFTPNLQCLLPRCPIPSCLFLARGPKQVRGNWQSVTPVGQVVHSCSSCLGYPCGLLSKGSFFRQNAQTGGFLPGGGEAH